MRQGFLQMCCSATMTRGLTTFALAGGIVVAELCTRTCSEVGESLGSPADSCEFTASWHPEWWIKWRRECLGFVC